MRAEVKEGDRAETGERQGMRSRSEPGVGPGDRGRRDTDRGRDRHRGRDRNKNRRLAKVTGRNRDGVRGVDGV